MRARELLRQLGPIETPRRRFPLDLSVLSGKDLHRAGQLIAKYRDRDGGGTPWSEWEPEDFAEFRAIMAQCPLKNEDED